MDKNQQSISRQVMALLLFVFTALYLIAPLLFVLLRPLFGNVQMEELDWMDPTNAYLSAGISMLALFLMCIVVYFRLFKQSYRHVIEFSGMNFKHIVLVILALAGGIFIAEGLYLLNHAIMEANPSSGFLEMEAEQAEQHRTWFDPKKPQLYPLALFVFAVLPAFVEELIFRGILMKKLEQLSGGKIHFAVIVSSALFAAFHMQPWNLLPMIGIACVFGYVYHYTKDIRYTMLMHFLYNGMQITIAFFFADSALAG